jgi:hypothetical protein
VGVIRRFYWELAGVRRNARDDDGIGHLPGELLADPALSPALAALRAMRPSDPLRIACMVELTDVTPVDAILRARAALARHEIALDVWPQLAGRHRFLNTSTAAVFQARLLPLLDALEGSDIGLALDLEPSEGLSRAVWDASNPERSLWSKTVAVGAALKSVGKSVLDARQGRRDLTELAHDLEARDISVHAAVLPPLAAGESDTLRTWALGCPVVDNDGRALFGLQAAMCYAPMAQRLPGRARTGARETEKKTLALWAARHRTAFDAVVVGLTSTGILGDEPVYEDPELFAEDVRAMDALAYKDVAVYALEGLLFGREGIPGSGMRLRPDVDRWLAASFGIS